MDPILEKYKLNDVLKWEQESRYSRDVVTILAGQDLPVGAVIGKVTASGKVTAIDYDGADGSEDPFGITIDAYDATLADLEGVAIARDALIDPDFLAWPLEFTSGGTDKPRVGDIITGATSADTAEIDKITLSSGSWAGGDAAGILWLRKVTGEFQAENLNIDARNIADFATIAAGLTITDNLTALKQLGILTRQGA